MDIINKLQKVYDIICTLSINVKECPEYFHDWFDVEIVDDCEKIMNILNEIFKFYKA